MILVIDGERHTVAFVHGYYTPLMKERRRYTRCQIDDSTDTVGQVRCHVTDTFRKAEGRKRAFARALRYLDRPTRTKWWAAYREQARD